MLTASLPFCAEPPALGSVGPIAMRKIICLDPNSPRKTDRINWFSLRLATMTLAFVGAMSAAFAQNAFPVPTDVRVTDHDATSVQMQWNSTAPLDGYTMFSV